MDRSGFGETAALNTLVLVDGWRLNNPDLSGADWKLIPLDRVARIEIVRGSRGSVLYGDNATDSVINIITKQGADGLRFGLEAPAGAITPRIRAPTSAEPIGTCPTPFRAATTSQTATATTAIPSRAISG